jgi:hypothetical protein
VSDKRTILKELEDLIDNAQCVMYEALKRIKDEELWPDKYPAGFWEYLKKKHGYSRSWFSQLQANYNAMTEIDVKTPFKNEYAMRTLRERDKQVRQAVYDRATVLAEAHGDEQVSAAHIKAVADVTTSILITGYADDGDGGMTAIDAQITEEYQERLLRRSEHIRNGREWFSIDYIGGTPFVFPDVPKDTSVTIKWYIVG